MSCTIYQTKSRLTNQSLKKREYFCLPKYGLILTRGYLENYKAPCDKPWGIPPLCIQLEDLRLMTSYIISFAIWGYFYFPFMFFFSMRVNLCFRSTWSTSTKRWARTRWSSGSTWGSTTRASSGTSSGSPPRGTRSTTHAVTNHTQVKHAAPF